MRALPLIFCFSLALAIEDVVPGEYLIRLEESLLQTEAQRKAFLDLVEKSFDLKILREFRIGDLGLVLASTDADESNIRRLREWDEVRYVEPNGIAYTDQTCSEFNSKTTWGLDRIDQRTKLVSTNPVDPDATYTDYPFNGTGVDAYIVDSGIDVRNLEMTDRVEFGYTAPGLPDEDDNGHGTHCAGTVGSTEHGVAKGVHLIAVKVINSFGSGSISQIVAGLEWVEDTHTNKSNAGLDPKSVVSMSLGGGISTAWDDAVEALVAAGVVVAVSAGNDDRDACLQSPARAPSALTVGAFDVTDTTASFTNYGSCVDVFAPGVDVSSTYPGNTIEILSGTSMACPHVAGISAVYMSSVASPTPSDVESFIKTQAQNTNVTLTPFSESHGSDNRPAYLPCPLSG